MSKQYDVVVVGAGHNGLIVASYIAKAGKKVCVVEKNSFIGGATNSVEVTLPGFKHDIGGIVHHVIRANPLLRNDELGLYSKFGLKYVIPEMHTANVFADGTTLTFHESVEATCQQIAQFSQKDAVAYKKFIEWCEPMMPLLNTGMFQAAPDFGSMISTLDKTPVGRELIRVMFMSAWDIATQWFEHPKTLMKVLKVSTEVMIGPEEKGTGLYLLTAVPGGHLNGGALCVGGSGALAKALGEALNYYGGTIMTNSEVVKITTSGGKATGVVLASGEEIFAKEAVVANVDPRISLNKWLDEGVLEQDFKNKVDRIQDPMFSGFMIAAALDEAPRYIGNGDAHKATFVEPLPTDLTAFREMFYDLKLGRMPKKEGMAPFVVVPTEHDPSRAPKGKHVLYLWHYVPYELADGGKEKWPEIKEKFADTLMDYYFSFTTNMTRDKVLKRTCFTPIELEQFNNNIVHGGVCGPGAYIYQMYSYRPIPELGHFKTPVKNLYLSGMSMHPGGSISGGGRAAAQAILEDLGIDFDDVIYKE